jgi:hypothetical protein
MDMSPKGPGRMVVALAVLAAMAALAWITLEPGKPRDLTWVLLGFFAFRTVLDRLRTR